jgi:hypothetical protein
MRDDNTATKTSEQPAAAPAAAGVIPPEQITAPPQDAFMVGGKQIVAIMGPYRDRVLTLPVAEADQAIADKWAREHPQPPHDENAPLPPPLTAEETEAAYNAALAWSDSVSSGAGDVAPTIDSLTPSTAAITDPDFTLAIAGSGFTDASVIFFAGHDEPTTLNGDGTLSTGVKPSLWQAAATVQCQVRNGTALSNALDFTFTEPVARRARR